MAFWAKLKSWLYQPSSPVKPLHLQRGAQGESAARDHLAAKGLKFLTANYMGRRGEIDLVFRDADCLVFVEVKTRSSGWTRPERAVNAAKQRALRRTAQDYMRQLKTQEIKYRFDIVEVLLQDGEISEIRHLENTFPRRTG
jgi:putative endonuclease